VNQPAPIRQTTQEDHSAVPTMPLPSAPIPEDQRTPLGRIVAAWTIDDRQALEDVWTTDVLPDLGSQWGQYEYVSNIDGVPRGGVGDHCAGVRGRVPGACIR
jgi:hypothetical protein